MWRNWEPSPTLRNALSGSTEEKGELKSSIGDRQERMDRGSQMEGIKVASQWALVAD